eukprot:193480_1
MASATNVSTLIRNIKKDKIKFLRFESSSVSGLSIGKLVPVASCKNVIKNGFGLYEPAWIKTTNHSIVFNDWKEGVLKNTHCKIYPDTYCKIPWTKPHNIASILIYPEHCLDPRSIALKQLNKLKTRHNIDLLSSFEHEFYLYDHNNITSPIQSRLGYDMSGLMQHQQLFTEYAVNFAQMGIHVNSMHKEHSTALWEISADSCWNIYAADDAYRIKLGVREMAALQNITATFVSEPHTNHRVNNFENVPTENIHYAPSVPTSHFNHCLWRKKKNVLTNSAHSLSEIGQYWIGGILAHSAAITAFVCPTIDCYHETLETPKSMIFSFNKVHVPTRYATWGLCNRFCIIRVKQNNNGLHFEFRLPSGLSNPYLVISAVVIAGIDGIENKILPPPEYKGYDIMESDKYGNKFVKLPSNLEEAIDALNTDKIVCDELGEFCTYYVNMKRQELSESIELKNNNCYPLELSVL